MFDNHLVTCNTGNVKKNHVTYWGLMRMLQLVKIHTFTVYVQKY
jgi:hypothetical protein